jgi:threonine/homoserine/homoserine lactone efflux protein
MISLVGVLLGFVFYMVSAVLGITSLILTIPIAYDVLRYAGAIYLAWLAWRAIRPGEQSALRSERSHTPVQCAYSLWDF